MPNTNSGKVDHSLVVVKNKLFVVSKREKDSEVFDNICKKFVTLKSPDFKCYFSINAFSIANKVFVLLNQLSKIICYDTNKNELSKEFCEVTKKLRWFSSMKLPCL